MRRDRLPAPADPPARAGHPRHRPLPAAVRAGARRVPRGAGPGQHRRPGCVRRPEHRSAGRDRGRRGVPRRRCGRRPRVGRTPAGPLRRPRHHRSRRPRPAGLGRAPSQVAAPRVRLGRRLLLPGPVTDPGTGAQLHRREHVVPPRRPGAARRLPPRPRPDRHPPAGRRGDRAVHPRRRHRRRRTAAPLSRRRRPPPGAGRAGPLALLPGPLLRRGPVQGRGQQARRSGSGAGLGAEVPAAHHPGGVPAPGAPRRRTSELGDAARTGHRGRVDGCGLCQGTGRWTAADREFHNVSRRVRAGTGTGPCCRSCHRNRRSGGAADRERTDRQPAARHRPPPGAFDRIRGALDSSPATPLVFQSPNASVYRIDLLSVATPSRLGPS